MARASKRCERRRFRYGSRSPASIVMLLRGLSERDREQVKEQARAALERFAGEGGYRIPGLALCAVAS